MKYIPYTKQSFIDSKYFNYLSEEQKETFNVLSSIFHFKTNNHVLENFIDWDNLENDPMYAMVFPRKEMIPIEDYVQLSSMFRMGYSHDDLQFLLKDVWQKVQPRLNFSKTSIPTKDGKIVEGIAQIFTKQLSLSPLPMTRTCHSYCTYCFRWIMFDDSDFQNNVSYSDPEMPVEYLKKHPEITDVLFTGADPLTLSANILRKYIEPVLNIDTVKVIRLSSKSLSYWPYRYTTDNDAKELLRLFEDITKRGKHLNFCAHVTHARELQNSEAEKAIKNIISTGAVIRCQGPIIKGVNDSPEALSDLWNREIELGLIPYYAFIEADHNAESCFKIPMARTLEIFKEAQKRTTALARTVRGPVFMNDVHRILLDGTLEINNEKFFVLKSLQAPPNMDGEGDIKLIPYSNDALDAGNLFELFSKHAVTESYNCLL